MDLLIKIHAGTPIKPLLTAYPQVSAVFLGHHMACVGCSMSDFDTLAEAAANYGLALDKLITEINAAIALSSA